MVGIPVKFENRARTGRTSPWKMLALESATASAEGWNEPRTIAPLAWTAREWLSPKALWNASTICCGVGVGAGGVMLVSNDVL